MLLNIFKGIIIMKRKTKENIVKHVALLIVAVMLFALAPGDAIKKAGEAVVSAIEAARPDYSVSPDYAARYPYGVFEFSKAEAEIGEGGIAKFKLIREGGTKGAVTVELKAIDVTAKYGVDYYVAANGYKLLLDDEYSGTLTENYLEENGFDYVTSDALTTDPVYKAIIGYRDTTLDDDETAELYARLFQIKTYETSPPTY